MKHRYSCLDECLNLDLLQDNRNLVSESLALYRNECVMLRYELNVAGKLFVKN